MLKDKDDWINAGRITKEMLKKAEKIVQNGSYLIDVIEKLEKEFQPAFPINVSMNEVAAHDTAEINDKRIIEGVVKVDIGGLFNGAIGDSAITLDLTDKYEHLLEANKEALENAIEFIKKQKEEVKVSEISKTIHDTAKKHKLGVILNLSGHSLEKNVIHSEPSIPNHYNTSSVKINKPKVFAIEPFFTLEDSAVIESGNAKIYQLISMKPLRDSKARKLLDYIHNKFSTRPFCTRWLTREFKEEEITSGIRRLLLNSNLYAFKPLKNKNNDIVSQFEHTIIFDEETIVTTE
ncbi:MAG: type II methionyl aminopeptidase [Candidatus Woesearchaeota archaeon]